MPRPAKKVTPQSARRKTSQGFLGEERAAMKELNADAEAMISALVEKR